MRPSLRLGSSQFRTCRILGAIVSYCDRRVFGRFEARRDQTKQGLELTATIARHIMDHPPERPQECH